MTRAVCPGSFDPVTNGHLDIIRRSAAIFDELVVATGTNPSKSRLFDPEERLEMLREVCAELPNVSVRGFTGLIVDNARTIGFPKANVVAAGVAATLRKPPSAPYDVAFLDPPYPLGEDDLAGDLASLADHGWLVPGALVVVERSARSPEPTWPDLLTDTRSKRYGETTLWYAEAVSSTP